MAIEFSTEKIPAWSLCYLVNGDIDGVTDEEIEMINKWMSENNVEYIIPVADDECEYHPYFDSFPAFGKPSEVLDCTVVFKT